MSIAAMTLFETTDRETLPPRLRIASLDDAIRVLGLLRSAGAAPGDLEAVASRIEASRRQGCFRACRVLGCVVEIHMPAAVKG